MAEAMEGPSAMELDLTMDFSGRVLTLCTGFFGYRFKVTSGRFRALLERIRGVQDTSVEFNKFVEDFAILASQSREDLIPSFETLRNDYGKNIFESNNEYATFIQNVVERIFNGAKVTEQLFLYFVFTIDIIIVCLEKNVRCFIPTAFWEIRNTVKRICLLYGLQEFNIKRMGEEILEDYFNADKFYLISPNEMVS